MKKITIIISLLVISLFTYSSIKAEGDVVNNVTESIIIEEEIMVEPWMTTPFMEKDNGITIPIQGMTNTKFGDYVIVPTEDVYHYNSVVYDVYNVYYDDPSMNLKIAVKNDTFIAYTSDYILFYECTKQGFGVRKVMFNNGDARDMLSPKKYRSQTILCKGRNIEMEKALGLIAVYVPQLMV